MKDQSYTSLLGVTHIELAMLLGVSRPLVTLFELGQRDLPAPAKQKLADLLLHLQSAEATAKRTKPSPTQNQAAKAHLGRMLKENEYQRVLTAKKIEALHKKIDAQTRRAQLSDFLNARKAAGKTDPDTPLYRLRDKTQKSSTHNMPNLLLTLELKQELLAYEEKLLGVRLQGLQ